MTHATAIANYIANGGSERDRLLAEAAYCDMCADREVSLGDPLGYAAEFRADAERLRSEAGRLLDGLEWLEVPQ